MADVLQTAATGRAKCRGCGEAIAKGELRFGESLPNTFAEGEALYWFHLVCAACMRPEKFGPTLAGFESDVPEREWLRRTAEFGVEYPRLPRLARAERASSGRAQCRKCRDLIPKDAFRLAVQIFEEGRMSPMGYLHVACAELYFGTRDIVERIIRLTPGLSAPDVQEIERTLRDAPPVAEAELRLAKTRPAAEPPVLATAAGDRPSGKS